MNERQVEVTGLTQDRLLHSIANRIRQSLELQNILNVTVAEVRDFLDTDRVKIYQFQPDGHGLVIAEALAEDRLPSLLGLHFPADDIPPYARELFVKARQRSVVDLSTCQIGLSPLDCPETGTPLDSADLRYRPVDPCHVEYLTAMGVKATIVVPIVLLNRQLGAAIESSLPATAQLWGLLVSHHADSRTVSEQELQFIQAVVDQVAIAISQSILLERVRTQAQQEASINRVTGLLYNNSTAGLPAALQEAVSAFDGVGGRLYLIGEGNQKSELYTCGEQPDVLDVLTNRPFEENLLLQSYLRSTVSTPTPTKPGASSARIGSVEWMRTVYSLSPIHSTVLPASSLWAINDIYREPLLRAVSPYFQKTSIRGMMLLPLTYGSQLLGCMSLFRQEVDTEMLWAGYHNPDTRQLMARQSFEVWRQLKTGQAQKWSETDIRLAQALCERFAVAINQHRLYQQVQQFNTSLKQQVEEKTADLQKSNQELQRSTTELERSVNRQQTLASIIAKLRESLDLPTIFKTSVQEIRNLLQADRVGIFQFTPGSDLRQGAIIVEDSLPEFVSACSIVVEDNCFAKGFAQRYHSRYIHQLDDIQKAGLKDCYIKMLEQFQIKALLMVPLFNGDQLWGLLCVHQCDGPRQWQPSEVEFVQQVAAQLSVALQHAVLLSRTQEQANQLSTALQELQEAQLHIVQSEKMSSLGQLVAGVAHEINNPVNFIHGNLAHINDYTETLLRLMKRYLETMRAIDPAFQQEIEDTDLDFILEDLPSLVASLKLGTTRIQEIVTSLRTFSRLDQAEMKSVNIHEGIDSTLLILRHRLKSNSGCAEIIVHKEYGTLPEVECYASQLNQVLMNLVANSIDALEEATDKKSNLEMGLDSRSHQPEAADAENEAVLSSSAAWLPTIAIHTETLEGDRVRITISDNGLGILPNVQQRLFDPFFTTKPVGKGTGLGLSISYQIIMRHHGTLQCTSEPGQGTTFIIEIPIHQSLVMPDVDNPVEDLAIA
jgi:GAF domain-containing protein